MDLMDCSDPFVNSRSEIDKMMDDSSNLNSEFNQDQHHNVQTFTNPSITPLTQTKVCSSKSVVLPLRQDNQQQFILDGLNVFLHKSDGKKIKTLEELELQTKDTLVPMIRAFAQRVENPEVHLVLKGFSLPEYNLNSLATCKWIMACIQANLGSISKVLPITLYITLGTSDDSERDDRFCHLLQMRYLKNSIIVSNDKYRSLISHCYQNVKYVKCNVSFYDPMQIDMKYHSWLAMLANEIDDPSNLRTMIEEGFDDDEAYSMLCEHHEYPRKNFSIQNGIVSLL